MTCRHLHRTLTRGTFPHGTPVAIYQCDHCGMALPKLETSSDVNVWGLPIFDEQSAEQGYTRVITDALDGTESKPLEAALFAKGNPHGKHNLR